MKRSEMVKNIQDLTKTLLCIDSDIFASYLLADLEAKGMLPPYKTKERENDKFQHTWDKENE